MRILFIVHQFMPEFATGTERVTLNLAKSAQQDGHEVEVVTCSICDASLWSAVDGDGVRFGTVEGICVHGLPGQQMDALVQLGISEDDCDEHAFSRFLDRRGPYDLVHVTHPMRMIDAIETVRARGIPYIVTLTDFFFLCYRINLRTLSGGSCLGPGGGEVCRSDCPVAGIDPAKLNARQLRMSGILSAAFDVVACSTFVSDRFKRELPQLSIRVIGHGIDLLRFGRPSPRETKGKVVFGYLGTISEAKGVQRLAEAFASAASCNALLKCIGPAYGDEQTLKRLKALSESDHRIIIKPAVAADQVPALLAEFDVFCLPSLVPETFSLTLHEAFAAGVPSLVSDLGYPADVVRRNRCGEVLPPGDVHAWKEAISEITSDPSLLDRWKMNVPLPARVEEEGFLYSQLYRAACC